MKKALVLGAGGFIGSHMVTRLKSEGYWVRGVDLKSPEFSDTTTDEFIIGEWERLKYWLNSKDTKRVTIFGYGAPDTDYEAVKLLNDSWGTRDERNIHRKV